PRPDAPWTLALRRADPRAARHAGAADPERPAGRESGPDARRDRHPARPGGRPRQRRGRRVGGARWIDAAARIRRRCPSLTPRPRLLADALRGVADAGVEAGRGLRAVRSRSAILGALGGPRLDGSGGPRSSAPTAHRPLAPAR